MKDLEVNYFKNAREFRNWLKFNFDKSPGIWMIYYKKHVIMECISYDEALEEALCFGWIDSLIKKLDDDKYVRKFTPRKDHTKWSEFNKQKVFELIDQGRMTQAGLEKAEIFLKSDEVGNKEHQSKEKKSKDFEVPDFIIKEFQKDMTALINFKALAPSHKKQYVLWINSAKTEVTRMKRIHEAVQLLKDNKKLGLK